jgi:ribosome-binding protein aMBF1 (putative translation factor)
MSDDDMEDEQCQAANSRGGRCGHIGTQFQRTCDGRVAWVCKHHANPHIVLWSEADVADTSDPLGQTIRELREMRGWSQDQLYKKCGVHASTISSYEAGTGSPSVQKLTRIASAFDADASDLLKDAGL